MKLATVTYCTGLVIRNSDTARGMTRPPIRGGWPSATDAFSIAGTLASELCVPAATAWAGRAAAVNRRSVVPPPRHATA
jgi:hypothetical protein